MSSGDDLSIHRLLASFQTHPIKSNQCQKRLFFTTQVDEKLHVKLVLCVKQQVTLVFCPMDLTLAALPLENCVPPAFTIALAMGHHGDTQHKHNRQ